MANIHVFEYSDVIDLAADDATAPSGAAVTYTRLSSAGAADDVTLQTNTELVRIWGEEAFGFIFHPTSNADTNSPWWPANAPVDLCGVAGLRLSVFVPAV